MIIEIWDFSITIIDIIIIIITLVSGLVSVYRGFIKEILAIAGWVGATFITLLTYSYLQPLTRKVIPITLAADVITGIILFLGSLLIITLVTHSIVNIIRGKNIKVKVIDRIFGLIFGLLRGIILLAFAYLLSNQILSNDEYPDYIKTAKTLPLIIYTSNFIIKLAPKNILEKKIKTNEKQL